MIQVRMRELLHASIIVRMRVVDCPQVTNSQRAEVIRAAGLLTVIPGQLHIMSIIDNEGLHHLQVILLYGCILHLSRHLRSIEDSLRPCHLDVPGSLKEH